MQAADYPDVPSDFGNWLAGFIDGEGCFLIWKRSHAPSYRTGLVLALRLDDKPVLEEIRDRTGIGCVSVRKNQFGRTPVARWRVQGKRDCGALLRLLERYPLRAKKARDFALWAEAVRLIAPDRRSGPSSYDWRPLERLKAEMEAGKRYDSATGVF